MEGGRRRRRGEGMCLLTDTYVFEAIGDQRRPEVLAGRVSLDWAGKSSFRARAGYMVFPILRKG